MNNKKIIGFIVFLLILIFAFTTITLAVYQPKTFKGKIDTDSNTENVKKVGGSVVGLIQVVGTIVSVGVLIVLGIKYMMGSAEERAEYKKTLFPYFIGAILIFAATNLADMIYSWASTVK